MFLTVIDKVESDGRMHGYYKLYLNGFNLFATPTLIYPKEPLYYEIRDENTWVFDDINNTKGKEFLKKKMSIDYKSTTYFLYKKISGRLWRRIINRKHQIR